MKAVLYFKDNGFGLTQDAKVVAKLLKHIGFEVLHRSPNNPVRADLSVHFEIPATAGIKRSDHSIFFPNFEWFFWDTSVLSWYNVLACKTRSAVPIARQFSNNVVYTGFASEDMYGPQAKRNISFYHIAGQSRLKNTAAVVECWQRNPDFPQLSLFSHIHEFDKLPKNIHYHFGPVDRETLRATMNANLIAVQPSATEGFGQVLWEALSTGSILVTTDAAPMSEIPTARLVSGYKYGYHNIQPVYAINPDELAQVIRKILGNSGLELAAASTSARQAWITNTNEFYERFINIL